MERDPDLFVWIKKVLIYTFINQHIKYFDNFCSPPVCLLHISDWNSYKISSPRWNVVNLSKLAKSRWRVHFATWLCAGNTGSALTVLLRGQRKFILASLLLCRSALAIWNPPPLFPIFHRNLRFLGANFAFSRYWTTLIYWIYNNSEMKLALTEFHISQYLNVLKHLKRTFTDSLT